MSPTHFNHIPSITKMLKSGGMPGVAYAHCALASLPNAQRGGWKRVSGWDQTYTITGPKGTVDCMFICIGRPIPGQGPGSGISILWVDSIIPSTTGATLPDECKDFLAPFQEDGRPAERPVVPSTTGAPLMGPLTPPTPEAISLPK